MFQDQCNRYHSIEDATGIVSNVDITSIAAFAALFTFQAIGIAKRTIIRTDAAITIRFNVATNGPISLAANEKLEVDWLGVSKIFITAAASANIKVIVGA